MSFTDWLFFLGLLMLSVGCWMVFAPLGLIVPGGVLCVVAALASRSELDDHGRAAEGEEPK